MLRPLIFALLFLACSTAAYAAGGSAPEHLAPNASPTIQGVPSTSSTSDLCIGLISGSVANTVVAVTLDWNSRDKTCALIRQGKLAVELQRSDLAYQIMCQSPEWRAADALMPKPGCR